MVPTLRVGVLAISRSGFEIFRACIYSAKGKYLLRQVRFDLWIEPQSAEERGKKQKQTAIPGTRTFEC